MKYCIVTALLFLLGFIAQAQKTHTVAAKESFTSIGRMYNVNGRVLAEFNKLDYDKGLSIGQVIKIPSSTTNATAPTEPVVVKPVVVEPVKNSTPKTGNEVFHVVQPKETLYALSKKYGVTIDDIKKWNNLTTDGFPIGARVIVGYSQNGTATTKEPVVKTKPVTEPEPVDKPKQETPQPPPQVKQEPPVQKQQEVIKPVVEKPVPPKKEEPQQQAEPTNASRPKPDFSGGIFKSSYDNNNTSAENGKAGVFKSTSGWEDGRYYCLQNNAVQGTIAKITNKANGKTIYAKVLDVIPDIKQNQGLVVRVSNAAAAELGVDTAQFDCSITYIK